MQTAGDYTIELHVFWINSDDNCLDEMQQTFNAASSLLYMRASWRIFREIALENLLYDKGRDLFLIIETKNNKSTILVINCRLYFIFLHGLTLKIIPFSF